MLLFETASKSADDIDKLAVLVSQVRAAGLDAALSRIPNFYALNRSHQYDLARLMTERDIEAGDRLVLIDAHRLGDAKLVELRRRARSEEISCVAIGSFETLQSEIGTKAKLSYILGEDPQVLSTYDRKAKTQGPSVPVIGVRAKKANAAVKTLPTVLLFDPNVEDANLKFLARSRKFRVIVLSNGKGKQAWIEKHGTGVPVYHFSEILPAHLAPTIDIVAAFRAPSNNYRIASLFANLQAQGAVMLDCSDNGDLASTNPAVIRSAPTAVALSTHLTNDILPALGQIAEAAGPTAAKFRETSERVLAELAGTAELSSPALAGTVAPEEPSRVVIVPTNGVGLGHAQRTSLIASSLDPTKVQPVFAAFPSCMKMIRSYGYDVMPLVSRTAYHGLEHANDVVNYIRLSALSKGASTLVFDGGYVFDSIYRTILDEALNGIWIRRGMWQPSQNNTVSLDREKVFGRVIVPTEAFEELNETYSHGDHVRHVGPIVQRLNLDGAARSAIRAEIAQRFGKPFKKLVVTMLGGGVAVDRKAQIQAISGILDQRSDLLNLLVVWPTATVEAGAFTWENTRVVKTHHASALVAASDLYISAVGYNSFHEVMYNNVPTIFMPQMNSFMDDQRTRALAAVERDLAVMVEPEQMMLLGQEIRNFLEGKSEEIRARLQAWEFPEPGNLAAATLIEEMAK